MAENNSDSEATSTSEEEAEPTFKYSRISNGLHTILNKDVVTCASVHQRFLVFGTFYGHVYLLDHEGNVAQSLLNPQKYLHTVGVNQVSVDRKGEYVASCSDDGKVVILGLFNDDNNQKLSLGKSIKSVAIDPISGKKFIVGDDKLSLYEKTIFKNLKCTVLQRVENGYVFNISWNNQFVAWASNEGVRIYDLNEKSSLGLMKWELPNNGKLENFQCNLKWSNATTLLIGWVDIIRICVIKKRSVIQPSIGYLPGFIVDPISTFRTSFYICGIAPLELNQLVVLGYPKERDKHNKALRPILCVLEYKNNSDFEQICTDSLSLRGYEEYNVTDYCLDCIIEENRYYIIAPKDVVVASLYETVDRIRWLIEHKKFEQAMEVISKNDLSKNSIYSVLFVGRLYIDYLISQQQYDEAAKLCLKVLGNNKKLWEEEVYKFVKVQQLRSVSAYLPRVLDPQVYEMVFFEFLTLDPPGLLNCLKQWEPTLYNTTVVIKAIEDHFNKKYENELLESLAILYSHEKKYNNALTMYLKLQNKDVFQLIEAHNLYDLIHQMIVPLIELDNEKAISMLCKENKIDSDIVVEKLEQNQEFLYMFLDAYYKFDTSGKYHLKLVNLYAKFGPDKLLRFLKRSTNYPIQEALDICKRESFYPEMVYLLGRMGNTSEALNIIIHKIQNIEMAIDFCKEHDYNDSWDNLINESLDNPEIMTKLLDGIVGFINPEALVNKIKLGQNIPELKKSLIKMLRDYSLQVSIQDGCNQILIKDYYTLHEKLVRNNRRAVQVSTETICGQCRNPILLKDLQKNDIIIFYCRHYFHQFCLPEKYNIDFCTVCNSKKLH